MSRPLVIISFCFIGSHDKSATVDPHHPFDFFGGGAFSLIFDMGGFAFLLTRNEKASEQNKKKGLSDKDHLTGCE
jgi:hypothetical protein